MARTGLVVAGAGARGAYEAGALTELLPRLTRRWSAPRVLLGTSAGALNVAGLAGLTGHDPGAAAAELVARWESVHTDEVIGLTSSAVYGASAYAGDVLGVPPALRRAVGLPDRLTRLLDADRLRPVVDRVVDWERLHDAVDRGDLDAVGVATTSADTGGTVVFTEVAPGVALPPYDPGRDIHYVATRLTAEHLLASAAVPVLFAPVHVSGPGEGWYLDGGVRLNTPLKPALRLGCDRVGVVATTPAEPDRPGPGDPAEPVPDVYSVAALALRIVLGAGVTEDLRTLRAVNALVEEGADTRHGRVGTWFAGPPAGRSTELAELAARVRRTEYGGLRALRNPSLFVLERLLGGALPDGRPGDHAELLSFLFFDPAFARAAAGLGATHAAAATRPDGKREHRAAARASR
ncbi:patatin-like phospholipase family protein [Pseudonocardia phyllosphaerae]|uniref:patatin-like phospholipase family protein n=1 Tax=Pseudonocardia phyllosphaerae TaxID=3390502 RepID=UPI0039785474